MAWMAAMAPPELQTDWLNRLYNFLIHTPVREPILLVWNPVDGTLTNWAGGL